MHGWGVGGVHGEGGHVWQQGGMRCGGHVARGVCVAGGYAWPGGACMAKGGMHGKGGMCMAKGDLHGEGRHAWQRGGMHGKGGACMANGGMRDKGGHA